MMDTECYAENVRPEQVLAWLQQRLGTLRLVDSAGAGGWLYQLAGSQTDDYDLQLTQLVPGLLGIWWLRAKPWPTQLAFAREAAHALRCRIWCSGEEMGLDSQNPYLWWRIDEAGEGPATWYGPAAAG